MTLERGLLLLESLLLVATLVLLLYNIREGKERAALIAEVGRAKRVLTRQEYFFAITEAMLDAKREILGCITGRPPVGDEIRTTGRIGELIAAATARGVRVKYLLPKFPDRLQIGLRYHRAGAEIVFSACLMVHNFRFIVVDESVTVLGIPDQEGEKEATKKGYQIPSVGLAMVMKDYFNGCEGQIPLRDYIREEMAMSGATLEHLAREFRLDEKILRELDLGSETAGKGA